MGIVFDKKHQLSEKQSLAIFPLVNRPAETYQVKLDMAGNSILSTVYVHALDPGASVAVSYFDFTTGGDLGEENLLKEHIVINAAGSADRKLVGNTHDKAVMRAVVTGGNVTFSVYATIVSSTASELTDAIIEENQTINFLTDKALAIGGFDEENNRWKFIRIGEDGAIIVQSFNIFSSVLSGNATISQNNETTIIDKTYSVDTRIVKILCEGDGYGKFTVLINDVPWGIQRNSWNDRNVMFDMGAIKLEITDNLKVKAKNKNYNNNDATFNIFVYEG